MTRNKIDCVGETCCNCDREKSCIRVAILTEDGEYANYTDVCYRCAASVAKISGMEYYSPDDFKVYHERVYGKDGG